MKKEDTRLFEARINGKPVELELEKSEATSISPLTLRVAAKRYQVEVEKVERHAPFTLRVNDALFKAQLREPARKVAVQTLSPQVTARAERRRGVVVEEGVVVAPMAGKIVSVRVKKGDAVKAGDVVCILEAMKMENEIAATKTGTVEEVNVSEGTAVNEGDILTVIK